MVKVGSAMLSHRTYVSVMVAMLIATTVGSLSVFVIGTVARPIMDDLELGYGTMGVVISMQRVASTLTAPFIGYAIDRIGPFKVLTIAMVFSTFSLFLTPLSSKLWMLLLTRIIAGLVFPAYWPSCTKIAAVSIPKNRIGFATAVFESGSVIGVVLTYILIPYARSWRFLFIIVAVIALLSLIMVSLLLPRNPKVEYRYLERNRDSVVKDIGYSKLFRNTIIIFFAFLFALQPWAFYTSWLSTFLVEKFVVELEDIWIPISIFLVIGMAFGILSSILSDKIHSLKGRKTILVLTLVATSIALFMLTVVEPGIYTWIFLAVSIISHRTFLPLAWTIINDTTPDKFVGLVSGVNALAGQISMMITPIIIAYTRESLGTFNISILLLSIFTATSIPLYLQLKRIETTQ
ncbi:MAG: MFS transporter [Ignisphaera sp.]